MKTCLNLGCGKKHMKSTNEVKWVNLDKVKLKGVDIVHDLNKFPYPFKDNEFDEITADNVLEHLENITEVMEELHRISKKNAIIKIVVPYFHYHGAFQDPTHKHFFTLDSFDYFSEESRYKFYSKARFRVVKKVLIPTWLGKFILFKKLLFNMLAMIFGELAKSIYFELKVIK